jgi:dethiobiotin synthase
MRGVFVTGTGTGVGKTVLSATLALARGASYWKPIQTGTESDTAEVQRLTGCKVLDQGVRLPDPVAPYLAAKRIGANIDLSQLLTLAPTEGDWVVEGAGGILVPLNENEMVLDLMERLALPVVIAARTTLGTINHTLLTLNAIRARGLTVERVVMIGDRDPDNRAAIETYGRVPVSELPWMEPLTPQALRFHPL